MNLPKDIKKPLISGLVIVGIAKVFDLIGSALDRNKDKEKRLGLELILAIMLIMLIRNLY